MDQFSQQVIAIATAISVAEGFGLAGAIPTVRNNPGDLIGANGEIQYYATLDEGWEGLYNQVSWMLSGRSHIYAPTMTITEVAERYTMTQQSEWARNVAGKLGVSVDTPLNEVTG